MLIKTVFHKANILIFYNFKGNFCTQKGTQKILHYRPISLVPFLSKIIDTVLFHMYSYFGKLK